MGTPRLPRCSRTQAVETPRGIAGGAGHVVCRLEVVVVDAELSTGEGDVREEALAHGHAVVEAGVAGQRHDARGDLDPIGARGSGEPVLEGNAAVDGPEVD